MLKYKLSFYNSFAYSEQNPYTLQQNQQQAAADLF
jgi:hypothetical protein